MLQVRLLIHLILFLFYFRWWLQHWLIFCWCIWTIWEINHIEGKRIMNWIIMNTKWFERNFWRVLQHFHIWVLEKRVTHSVFDGFLCCLYLLAIALNLYLSQIKGQTPQQVVIQLWIMDLDYSNVAWSIKTLFPPLVVSLMSAANFPQDLFLTPMYDVSFFFFLSCFGSFFVGACELLLDEKSTISKERESWLTSRSSRAIARVNNERNILAMWEYYFRWQMEEQYFIQKIHSKWHRSQEIVHMMSHYVDFIIMIIIENLITCKYRFPEMNSTTLVIKICTFYRFYRPRTIDFN